MCKYLQKLVKYCTNIVQILCKYCANIVQILRKYCTNIIQIFFESNRAIQEHKRLNRAKCYLITHPLTHPICENTIHWAAYAAKNIEPNHIILLDIHQYWTMLYDVLNMWPMI